MSQHCAECDLPIPDGELCRDVIDEFQGSPVLLPAHQDCRLALAREYAGMVRALMVMLAVRRAEKGRVAA